MQTVRTSHSFELPLPTFQSLSYGMLLRYIPAELANIDTRTHYSKLLAAEPNSLTWEIGTSGQLVEVQISYLSGALEVNCNCGANTTSLCAFQIQACLQTMNATLPRLFLDADYRHETLKKAFPKFGIPDHSVPEEHLQVVFQEGSYHIIPLQQGVIPIDTVSLNRLQKTFQRELMAAPYKEEQERVLLISNNRFQDQFQIELVDATLTKLGKLRPPIRKIEVVDELQGLEKVEELKLFSALLRFQNPHRKPNRVNDIKALRCIINDSNPFPVYINMQIGNETLQQYQAVHVSAKDIQITLNIHRNSITYIIQGELTIGGKRYELENTHYVYDYFLLAGDSMYLLQDEQLITTYLFLKEHQNYVVVYEAGYEQFRATILDKIQDAVSIRYSYLQPATEKEFEAWNTNLSPQSILYLDDAGQYVHLTPVVQYNSVEVPVLSARILYAVDSKGRPFEVPRNKEFEIEFTSALLVTHPDLSTQIEQQHFYLHKKHFLNEEWFLDAFEKWQEQDIEVRGFQTLTRHRLSPQRAQVNIELLSGHDWFETKVKVHFGKEVIPLRKLYTAVKNRTRYVTLSDGSKGILPMQWLTRFQHYFSLGEIEEETIKTTRFLFKEVEKAYSTAYISPAALLDIQHIKKQVATFDGIQPITPPTTLQTTLRPYQLEGIKWLSTLEELRFGACLADDMGLGKTIQIIAFLLVQKAKYPSKTSLIIVPTSLLQNWADELAKFAPSLRVNWYYGETKRHWNSSKLENTDILLTSYHTVVNGGQLLQKHTFHYIILDESQQIKNPNSQRFRAVSALKATNRIILTGTPVENNTLDLYAQFSFACPGLLGSLQYFKDYYLTPIDTFKDAERADELRQRIYPFLLRRTKQQVAPQLPPKTEMVIYCEMETAQRRVYDAYAQEFRNYLNHQPEGDLKREQLHVLQGLTKLRQICNSPALLNDNELYGEQSAKISLVLEKIQELMPHHKILVFSQFVGMLDLIRAALKKNQINHRYLTGQTTNRAEEVRAFQENDADRVFLISLKAGGTGLNLTAADYVFLVDPWWNPSVENQAIDRAHRIGQEKPVVAVRFITPQTIEEKIASLQQQKSHLSEQLIQTEENFYKSLSKDDLLQLL